MSQPKVRSTDPSMTVDLEIPLGDRQANRYAIEKDLLLMRLTALCGTIVVSQLRTVLIQAISGPVYPLHSLTKIALYVAEVILSLCPSFFVSQTPEEPLLQLQNQECNDQKWESLVR